MDGTNEAWWLLPEHRPHLGGAPGVHSRLAAVPMAHPVAPVTAVHHPVASVTASYRPVAPLAASYQQVPAPVGHPAAPGECVSWGVRVAAAMIDLVVLAAFCVVAYVVCFFAGRGLEGDNGATIAVFVAIYLAPLLVATLYQIAGAASGQTVGKRAMGYRVARLNGRHLGGGLATGRYLLSGISGLVLMVGWLAPLWSPRRQTWHDSMSGTVAVRGSTVSGARASLWAAVVGALAAVIISVALGATGARELRMSADGPALAAVGSDLSVASPSLVGAR